MIHEVVSQGAAVEETPRRICSRCSIAHPATSEFFYRSPRGLFGLEAACKPCSNARKYAERKKNPEVWKRAKARDQRKHKERVNAANKRHRERNPGYWQEYVHRRRALYENAPGEFTKQDLYRLALEQEGRCCYCSDPMREPEIEHMVPLTRDGTNEPANIALACKRCNASKGDMLPDEYAAYLADLR